MEGSILSVAEDAECVRLERVSFFMENALAGVVDADMAEPEEAAWAACHVPR
jgi:hypothetical protein